MTTKPRKRGGTADKAWSLGLAGATCLGLVGLVGARSITDAAASDTAPVADVSSTGLSQAELDAYAASLNAQQVQLDAYRAQLVDVAQQLQAVADATTQSDATVIPVAKKKNKSATTTIVPAPRPQAAPQLQAAPQAKTRSS